MRGAIATHTENSVRAAIVNSLRGPARDLAGFVGFDANLEKILMEVTTGLAKDTLEISYNRNFIS